MPGGAGRPFSPQSHRPRPFPPQGALRVAQGQGGSLSCPKVSPEATKGFHKAVGPSTRPRKGLSVCQRSFCVPGRSPVCAPKQKPFAKLGLVGEKRSPPVRPDCRVKDRPSGEPPADSGAGQACRAGPGPLPPRLLPLRVCTLAESLPRTGRPGGGDEATAGCTRGRPLPQLQALSMNFFFSRIPNRPKDL